MTLVKFADIVHLSTSRTADPASAGIDRFVGLEHIEPENLHIRSWGNVADGTTFNSIFKRGQVLFGKRRAYQCKVAVADFDGVCSSDIYVFESKDPGKLLPEFLPFICQSEEFIEYAVKTSAGSLSPRTSWSHLANYKFYLPTLPEQLRMVEMLWAVEIYKQRLANLSDATSRLLDSLRAELVASDLKIGSQCIGDVADLVIDRHNVIKSESYPISGVYSFGRGLLSRGNLTGVETQYKYLHRIHEGQLVLSKLKAWEGAVAVVESEYDLTYLSPEYPTFDLNRDRIIPEYMKLVCESPWFWRNIAVQSKGTAQRRVRIYPQDFLKVPIFVPSLQEQIEIVNRVNEVKNVLNLCNKGIDDTSNLKRVLLSKFLINKESSDRIES